MNISPKAFLKTLVLENVKVILIFKKSFGISLVVHWLRLCTPNAGDLGSIPGQGTRSHMPQLKILRPVTKIPCAAAKTQHSQRN